MRTDRDILKYLEEILSQGYLVHHKSPDRLCWVLGLNSHFHGMKPVTTHLSDSMVWELLTQYCTVLLNKIYNQLVKNKKKIKIINAAIFTTFKHWATFSFRYWKLM
jgi:hypothetical protein